MEKTCLKIFNTISSIFCENEGSALVKYFFMLENFFLCFFQFSYFRHQQYYGLSCFALKSVSSECERGARMKSVGIICTKYTSLHKHQEFLEKEVKWVISSYFTSPIGTERLYIHGRTYILKAVVYRQKNHIFRLFYFSCQLQITWCHLNTSRFLAFV